MITRTLEIGALCDPISKQLDGLLSKEDAKHLDLDNEAITRCYIRGLVGDAETARARKRLLKRVQDAVGKHRASNSALSGDTRKQT